MAFQSRFQNKLTPKDYLDRRAEVEKEINELSHVLAVYRTQAGDTKDLTESVANLQKELSDVQKLHVKISSEIKEMVKEKASLAKEKESLLKKNDNLEVQYNVNIQNSALLLSKNKTLSDEIFSLENTAELLKKQIYNLGIKEDDSCEELENIKKDIVLCVESLALLKKQQKEFDETIDILEDIVKEKKEKIKNLDIILLKKQDELKIISTKISQDTIIANNIIDGASTQAGNIIIEAQEDIDKKIKENDDKENNLIQRESLLEEKIRQVRKYKDNLEKFYNAPCNEKLII